MEYVEKYYEPGLGVNNSYDILCMASTMKLHFSPYV
jgi:hypothetical protein